MTAMGMVRLFGQCSRAMADRNSPTLVVLMTSPASIPQAYTLCTRPRKATNIVRHVPCSTPMHQTVNAHISA